MNFLVLCLFMGFGFCFCWSFCLYFCYCHWFCFWLCLFPAMLMIRHIGVQRLQFLMTGDSVWCFRASAAPSEAKGMLQLGCQRRDITDACRIRGIWVLSCIGVSPCCSRDLRTAIPESLLLALLRNSCKCGCKVSGMAHTLQAKSPTQTLRKPHQEQNSNQSS